MGKLRALKINKGQFRLTQFQLKSFLFANSLMLSKTPKDVIFGSSSLAIPFQISVNVWSLFLRPSLPVGKGRESCPKVLG